MAVVWLNLKVFVILLLPSILFFVTVRSGLFVLLQRDPLFAWKRLHFIPLGRLTEIYWHVTFLYFTLASMLNILSAITVDNANQRSEVLTGSMHGFLERRAGVLSSPLTVLPRGSLMGDQDLLTQIETVRKATEPDMGLLALFLLFTGVFLFWLVRLALTVQGWRREARDLLGERSTSLGSPPRVAFSYADGTKAQIWLVLAVGISFLYSVLVVWFGLFLAANIVLYLISGPVSPFESVALPFIWMEILLSRHFLAGALIAKAVLAFFALCLLAPPLYYFSYRTTAILQTLKRLHAQRIRSEEMADIILSLSQRKVWDVRLVFNPSLLSPVSYRFLGQDTLEWPWRGLPPVGDHNTAKRYARFYLAHELHHLRHHATRIRILQLFSSLTLVSHNYLTLAVDSLAYELEADAGALAFTADRDAAVDALGWLSEQADLRLALRFEQSPSIVQELVNFQFASDVVGYLHPAMNYRIAALQA